MIKYNPFSKLGDLVLKTWEVSFWKETTAPLSKGEEYELVRDSITLEASNKKAAKEAVKKLIADWQGFVVGVYEIKEKSIGLNREE